MALTPRLYNRTYILLTEYGRYVLKGNIIGRSFNSSEVVLYKIPYSLKIVLSISLPRLPVSSSLYARPL